MSYLESDRKTKLVGPKQINFNGTLQLSCFRYYRPETILYRRTWLGRLPFGKRHLDWFVMKNYDHVTPKAVDWVTGSAMFVEREAALRSARWMTDSSCMEDVDWCRRFWEKRISGAVYCPGATVYHYHAKGAPVGDIRHLFQSAYLVAYHERDPVLSEILPENRFRLVE